MTRLSFIASAVAALLAGACGSPSPAQAQETFPARPIRIVLPLPAGSAPDVVARVVAEQLSGNLGQQVIVENRPGAGGAIAVQAVASAPPDGHTLLLGVSSIWTILPTQKDKLALDMSRAFVQVGMIVGGIPIHLAVSPRLGVRSFAEFAALARAKPGEIVIGTNGAGTLPHFAALALARKGDIPITVVPYNQGGTTAAISDIMGGRVHGTIEAISGLRGAIQAGDVKLIGVMQAKPDPLFPDVPTIGTAIPGFSMIGFMSIAAPAGTPERIVLRLNAALAAALATPIVRQRFDELSFPLQSMTPAETAAFVQAEQKRWWPLVNELAPPAK
jgi:tripartite-type tricarboxylate transporter receptor subunit TctC